jgi:predicted transcriptional regulator
MKEHITKIVAAYVGKNHLEPAALPSLIAGVSQAFGGLGQPPAAPPIPATPAVPIRRSITADKITCLDCAWSGVMLKRHLLTAHSLSVDEYRTRWKLPSGYPMIAPNYAVRRAEIAKAAGLGRRRPGGTRRK